jgi:hypothetical protein
MAVDNNAKNILIKKQNKKNAKDVDYKDPFIQEKINKQFMRILEIAMKFKMKSKEK